MELQRIGAETPRQPRPCLPRKAYTARRARRPARLRADRLCERGKDLRLRQVLLDQGMGSEEFLVSVSRARGTVTAYGVAALDLTDPELGPGKRQIEDEAHELRAAAERSAAQPPGLEARLREQIAALSPLELARRRSELEGSSQEGSPQQERLRAVEARIEKARVRLDDLQTARAVLLEHPQPESRVLARLESQGASR